MTSRALPTVVKVFGILHCVFGGFSLLSGLWGLTQQSTAIQSYKTLGFGPLIPWLQVSALLAPVVAAILAGLGAALLTRQPWARKAAVYFAFFTIGLSILNALIFLVLGMGMEESPVKIGALLGAVIGGVVGCIYPTLTAVFLNRDEVKAAMD